MSVVTLLAVFFASGSVRAQEGPGRAGPERSADAAGAAGGLIRDQWNVRDGLPVNHANALLQTPDGFLWMATFDGLVRYDGIRFTVFDAGNTPSLPSSRIVSLFPGRDGSFWLETEQGHLVRGADGRFEPFAAPTGWLLSVYVEPEGPTWLATIGGLYRYEGGQLLPAFEAALADREIADVLRDRRGTLWVATLDDGVWREEGGRLRRSTPESGTGTVLVEANDGTLWAGGHGVSRLKGGAWEPFAPEGAPWLRPTWGEDYRVWDVYQEPGGTLWFATTLGLYRYSADRDAPPKGLRPLPGAGAVVSQVHRRNNFSRCSDGTLWLKQEADLFRGGEPVASVDVTITDILCDREGSLWVTTTHDGLYRFRRPLLHTYSEAEGLGFRNVYAIYEDGGGGLWFAGYGGTVSRLYDGAFQHFEVGTHFEATQEPARTSDQAIYEDREGNLWLGFQVCPAARRDADGSCTRFGWAPGAPERERNLVHAIRQTSDGTLWFGTLYGLYRLEDGEWTRFTTADGLSDDYVRYFLESRHGTLYAATLRGGVVRYREGEFTSITTAGGLPSDHVRALYEDADGTLWIGTEDRGLARLDPATGAITTIRQADGLYSDGIHQILEDAAGRLWMSTNQGLFWVRRAELDAFARGERDRVQSVFYTERDGMRNREANGGRQQSALEASDGRLWFATQDGVVVVDPAEIVRHAPPPQPIIGGVTTAGGTVPVPLTGALALPAEQRSFQIAYTAPTFVAPERMRFRYKLEGFDAEWVEAGSRREAVYTKVPPGEYVFRVAASNDGVTWTEDGPALALALAPRPTETWWFFGLCGLAVTLLLVAAYRTRTRQLYRRQIKLDAQVAERTRELRAEKQKTEEQAERLLEMDRLKSRFFTNVSHEFRTPLTLTIGPLEDLQAPEAPVLPPEASRKVDLALRNSRRLLRLIGQLLDIAKLEAGELRLDARSYDLAAFVRGVARSFVPLAERRRVRFTVEVPATSMPTPFDAEKLEQVLANLLSNAFKFTSAGDAIHVSIAADGTDAVVTVRDSGVGISAEALPHLFERFYQADATYSEVQSGTGIGLSLAKDLVELHGGTITVESAVGFGTTFTVRLPHVVPLDENADAAGGTDDAAFLIPGAGPGEDTVVAEGAEETGEVGGPDEEDRTTILVADDNAEIRAYVRSHLEPRYRVLEAADGRKALETARMALPDLVVSDVMMPHLDGFELVQALRADRETDFIPVILLTARATEEDKLGGLSEGADAYLTKPFSVRELQVRIENLIASRQRLKERFATTPTSAPPSNGTPSLETADGLAPSDEAYLARARAAVESHLGDDGFGVEQLAAALEQSRSTVHRRLRDTLNQTPTTFIREVRLERAATLLRERSGTVSEVAYAVGFKSVSHFSQAFRQTYEVSPSAYLDPVPSLEETR